MIDRKALWLLGLLIAVLTAAGVWRLSLLADWHQLPANGPGDSHTINGLIIFWGPVTLLLVLVFVFVRRWLVTGPPDAEQPWRRWSTQIVIVYAALVVLMQAFITARSLGLAQGIDRLAIAHTVQVAVGILLVTMGNALPKMPRLTARFRPFQLDPWQWNRQMRFAGKLLIALGVFIALIPLLVPQRLVLPAMAGTWLAAAAASFWHRARLKRAPSPLP